MQSIVMPVHNGSAWLDEALSSVLEQTFTGTMELSVFNDASTVRMHCALLHVYRLSFTVPQTINYGAQVWHFYIQWNPLNGHP